jgi:peptidoglycan/xylan/chitin deacetylase (PgdA/CDA1 family)
MRTMLWYEELFLLFLRAPAGTFEVGCEGVVIGGELGSREERRSAWWDSVKRLSRLDAARRASFLQAARQHFGLESWRGFDVGNPASCRRFGLLTCAELRELASAGMTIGAHTLSHPMLSQAPAELANIEITESRKKLESALQKRVWAFAYPFGDAQSVTPQVLAIPKRAGYEAAFLNFGGGLGTELPPYALPRLHVTSDMSLGEFDAHVSGFHTWLQQRARWKAPVPTKND